MPGGAEDCRAVSYAIGTMSQFRCRLLDKMMGLALGGTVCLAGCGSLSMCRRVTPRPYGCEPQGPITIGPVQDSVPRVVQEGPAPPSLSVRAGDTLALRINGLVFINDDIKWSSSDDSVATVGPAVWPVIVGKVVGKKAGIVTIRAKTSGQQDSVTVTVTDRSTPH